MLQLARPLMIFVIIGAHLLLLQPLSTLAQSSCKLSNELGSTIALDGVSGGPLLAQRFEVTPTGGVTLRSVELVVRISGTVGLYQDQAGQLSEDPVPGQAQLTLHSFEPLPSVYANITTYSIANLNLPKGFYWLLLTSGSPNSNVNWNLAQNRTSSNPPAIIPSYSTVTNLTFGFSFYGCDTTLVSNVNTTASTPQLTFNLTAPTVQIAPKGESGLVVESASVAINMAQLSEMRGSTVVRSAVNITQNGQWTQLTPDQQLGSSQTFVYNASLAFDDVDAATQQGRVEVQFDLFDKETNVSLGNVTAFAISPDFAKLTLRVFEWPFSEPTGADEPQHRLEVRLNIDPPVSAVENKSAQANGVTVFKLRHANDAEQRTTEIRVVNVVERDGANVQAGGVVEYNVDVAKSQLVLSFARFESSLIYDPDLGVLLGAKREDVEGGSDSNLWIIAVAVVVPVAVVVVIVIMIGILIGYMKRRRNQQHLANLGAATVNFNADDHRNEDV